MSVLVAVFSVLALVFILLTVLIIFKLVIEPLNMLIFNKPIYIHYYPFPRKLSEIQKEILSKNFQFYNRLKPKYKRYFEHRVLKLIRHYNFEGRDIEVTEEMKVTISATYVMLTFGMREYLNPLFKRIIIYPDIYYSSQNDNYHKGEFNPRMESIVFSWKHFKEGIDITNDNLNLGLHEFTHAFHIYALKSDKATFVLFNESLQNLFRVVSKPDVKQRLVASGFLRDYAYENQFEFVAVLLEYFFESPEEFKLKFPSIFLKVKQMINFNKNYFLNE